MASLPKHNACTSENWYFLYSVSYLKYSPNVDGLVEGYFEGIAFQQEIFEFVHHMQRQVEEWNKFAVQISRRVEMSRN